MTVITKPEGHALSAFDAFERGAPAPAWLADGILSAWSIATDGARVSLITVSENATFLVAVGDAPVCVVRVQRPGYISGAASIESELRWVQALRTEAGVRTPAPIRGGDGLLVQQLAAPDGRWWTAVAFAFAEGVILEDLPDAATRFTDLGRLTGVLHQHSRSWTPPPGFARFDWSPDDMVGPRARWGSWEAAVSDPASSRLLGNAQERALSVLANAGRDTSSWGLIHSDLRPSNVLADEHGLTVIDFDDCGFTYFLYDFAAALTFYEHRDEAREMASRWFDGYQEVLPIGAEGRAQAAALSMIRRLTMLGWSTTHRSDALPRDLWDENLPGTILVAERYLRDPLWLVDPS